MAPDDPTKFFMDAIRGGLERTPRQGEVWLIVVGSFIAVLLFLSLFFVVRGRLIRLTAARRRFAEILMQRGLSPDEQALMSRLERYFRHDKSRLPELAHNPSYFNAAARKMREAEPESEEALARLRYKLRLIFKNAFQAPHSTIELTPGMAVYLTLNGRTEFNAMISDVQDRGFYIKTALAGRPGDEAAFELHSHAGVFKFKTYVRAVENGFFVFAHTENIIQVQKRRYYRKNLNLPVTVVRPSTRECVATNAIDISGGGAKIHDPGFGFRENEAVTLTIYLGRTEHAMIPARVLRLDRNHSTVSVSFEKMSEALRDKIVKLSR